MFWPLEDNTVHILLPREHFSECLSSKEGTLFMFSNNCAMREGGRVTPLLLVHTTLLDAKTQVHGSNLLFEMRLYFHPSEVMCVVR